MLKRIIIHWTAGTGQPNKLEYQHYHYLINKDGIVVEGKYKPQDNENCYDGKYAQHTGGGNTGSIGVAVCGMLGFTNRDNVGNYPLTQIQCEKLFEEIARLSKKYNIPITPDTVMTHYEFGQKHRNTSSFGKIDITFLPPYPWVSQQDVGKFIRSKAKWYLQKYFY